MPMSLVTIEVKEGRITIIWEVRRGVKPCIAFFNSVVEDIRVPVSITIQDKVEKVLPVIISVGTHIHMKNHTRTPCNISL